MSNLISKPNTKKNITALILTIVSVGLITAASFLPLWQVNLVANNYPQGLKLISYGTSMEGDLYELNIINHYVGMQHILPDEIKIMGLFYYAIGGCVLLMILGYLYPQYKSKLAWLMLCFPIGVLLVIQYYLYTFGNNLDPAAPIRMKPFTPLVIGVSSIMNFKAEGMVRSGFILIVVSILLSGFGETWFNMIKKMIVKKQTLVIASLFILYSLTSANGFSQESLQERINQATANDTLVVAGVIKAEPIVISKPLTIIGKNKPVVDGLGKGSVVTITADHVRFSGFEIKNSGQNLVDESAGIKVESSFVTVSNNELHHVFFGIYIAGGKKIKISDNYVHPGKDYALRAGHAITIWNCAESEINGNRIENARDGIFLNYTENVLIYDNVVSDCRYGLHSMYSSTLIFKNNHVYENLLGCALMYSKNMIVTDNIIEWHRKGSSSYGFLLKDIEEVTMQSNIIRSNTIAVYAEGVSQKINSNSVIKSNTIEGNDCAFALHSTVSVTIKENRVADNLKDIEKLGEHISSTTHWSENGRGNQWANYRGYDADGDLLGDQPYIVKSGLDHLTDERNPLRIFLHTPAHRALENMIRLFPLLEEKVLLNDAYPVMQQQTEAEAKIQPLFISVMILSTILGLVLIRRFSVLTGRNWI